jgi:hypothetical protein
MEASGIYKLGLVGKAQERQLQERVEQVLKEAVETNVKGAYGAPHRTKPACLAAGCVLALSRR